MPDRVVCLAEVNESSPGVFVDPMVAFEASGEKYMLEGRDLLKTFVFFTESMLEGREKVAFFNFRRESVFENSEDEF